MNAPRIAIQNIHRLPNLTSWRIHNYALELVRRGHVKYLYFDIPKTARDWLTTSSLLWHIWKVYGFSGLRLGHVRFLFSAQALRKHCDILLNFNSASKEEFTPAIRAFPGIKIFHVMDYFWREPASSRYAHLSAGGVQYLMSYGRSDRDCPFFKHSFPSYAGKVIPVPFGFTERFVDVVPFADRSHKCVALGSVNPLRPYDAPEHNFKEPGEFYSREKWFHPFRRKIVESRSQLSNELDSLLPVFPQYKDTSYDIVATLNSYRMFTSDESLFYFPPAKTFEGPACGSVLVCSDHPCFAEFGFHKDKTAIVYKQGSIESLQEEVRRYINSSEALEGIHRASTSIVRSNYSHAAVADNLAAIFSSLFAHHKARNETADLSSTSFWPSFEGQITYTNV